MTSIILNKLEQNSESKKNKKLWISRNNERSRFKNGVMNLSKNFMKNVNSRNSRNSQDRKKNTNSKNNNQHNNINHKA